MPGLDKWDTRFLELAELVASWSKDPSRKVGAVIVRPDRTIAGVGYNGFPRGVVDNEARYNDREVKYQLVVHAEANAILSAGESVKGMTLYGTLYPCCECAKLIIQSGIRTVIVPRVEAEPRFAESMAHAAQMFFEAGVVVLQK